MKADSDAAAAENAESEQMRILFLDFLHCQYFTYMYQWRIQGVVVGVITPPPL